MNSDNKMPSPCVRKCCLDEEDICMGCFRSLDEITQWTAVDKEAQLKYLENSRQRRKNYRVLDF